MLTVGVFRLHSGLSDALDWVIRSALNAHETARDQGKLTEP